MLVPFDFNCKIHGLFEFWFNSIQYPTRDFPFNCVTCPKCNRLAEYVASTRAMSPDPYWNGKYVESLDMNISSRDTLRKVLKSKGLTQMTHEDLTVGNGPITQKTNNEMVIEHLNNPDVKRKRIEAINKAVDGFGVIDSVKME